MALVEQIDAQHLMGQLIDQLKKDADLSGIAFEVSRDILPQQFLGYVHQLLLGLLLNDFGSYLNFLYRVDVPEPLLKSIRSTEPKEIIDIVTLLVLKREWQKVYFRNKSQ